MTGGGGSHSRVAPRHLVPHTTPPTAPCCFLPRQTRCAQRGRGFAEARGGISVAKYPEAPRAPGLWQQNAALQSCTHRQLHPECHRPHASTSTSPGLHRSSTLSRGRGVKCKAARQSYKYICSVLQLGAAGRLRGAERSAEEVGRFSPARSHASATSPAPALGSCSTVHAWAGCTWLGPPSPVAFALCPMLSSWGGRGYAHRAVPRPPGWARPPALRSPLGEAGRWGAGGRDLK